MTGVLACACGATPVDKVYSIVPEAFVTDAFVAADVDSMAVWLDEEGRGELLTTAKATDELLVFDAANGQLLRRIGQSGNGLGEFRRPNGIAVEGNLALVVERDNRRLQVLSLPGDRPIGVFGDDVLRRPYGVAVFTNEAGWLEVYVTDNYLTPEGTAPPLEDLGQRVHHFRVRVADGGLDVEHVRAFSDTEGRGVLLLVESIAVDPTYDRLLVADEDSRVREIKIYTLDGRFTGQVISSDLFDYEPEGMALYACNSHGSWVVTDQDPEDNTFHVLDRRSLALLGSFQGQVTRRTDGIAIVQRTLGPLSGGALYASHGDAHVTATSWDRILESIGLPPTSCS